MAATQLETLLMTRGETPPIEVRTSDYELVTNPSLRDYLINFEEAAKRKEIVWPIQSSKIDSIFAEDLKLPRYRIYEIVNHAREQKVISFTRIENGKKVFYVVDRKEACVVAALCWSITENPKFISLKRRCDFVRKALGSHSLAALIKDPVLPLWKKQIKERGAEFTGEEEGEIFPEKPKREPSEIGKGYFMGISPDELEGSKEIGVEQLEEYLKKAKRQVGCEQASALKIGISPNALKIIISCVVVARRKQERPEDVLKKRSEFLFENLTYEYLTEYIEDCLFLLRRYPKVENLYTLFAQAKKTLEKQSGKAA